MSLFIVTSAVLFVLLFPIFVNVYLYADSDGGKVGFAVYLFGVAKVFGGYAAPYSGGIAFHVSKGTALLLPYKEILNARKKFEITKGFIVSSYRQVVEIGGRKGEAAAMSSAMVLRKLTDLVFFFLRRKIDVRLEGDILVDMTRCGARVSVGAVVLFNLLIVLIAGIKLLLERLFENVRRRKKQKSQ